MKILKRVISISICIMMLISSVIMMQTAAVSSVWTGSGTTTKQLAGNYEGWTEVTYSKDTETTINYGENINLVQGAKFEFVLVTGKFKASNGVRNSDTNKISFVFESGSNSIIVVFRALYENTAANINKIQVDILYKTGSVTTIEESYEIAQNVINVKHSVSIKKESDHYFIIVDGVSAIPLSKYSDLNFSSTTLKAEIKTTADNPNIRLSPVSNQTDSVLYGQWSTFGVTQVSTNEDLTTRYKVDDKISDLYDTEGASRVREALVNHTGYDVNKPIIIEASMSVVNVPAVWWGVGLSRKPYDYHSRRAYDENGNIIEEKDFGSIILNY